MYANNATATTVADYLVQLGDISPDRIRVSPPLGMATLADCIAANETEQRRFCELVDGSLVEKAVSYEASVVAATILSILKVFVSRHQLGLISGPGGFFRFVATTRGPDVALSAKTTISQSLLNSAAP